MLFESQLKTKIWEDDETKDMFDSCDINYLLEQQIIIMMNMVPNRDMNNSKEFLVDEEYDILAPLEILNGNSLCDYMLTKSNFV